jgi:hypothetical protein
MLNTQDSIQQESKHHDLSTGNSSPIDRTSTLNRARTSIELDVSSATKTDVAEDFDCVIQAICRDAKSNTKEYLLRSNTGHDGE